MTYHDDCNDNNFGGYPLYPEKLDSLDFLQYAPQDAELRDATECGDMAAYTIAWLQRNAGDAFIAQYGRRILGVTNWFCSAVKKSRQVIVPRDDVFQTACLLSLKIKAECTEERWLAFRMKQRLPMYMWRELAALLPQGCDFDPAEVLARIPDRRMKRWLQMLEIDDMLERALDGKELYVARALLADKTQAQIAKELGVAQSVISARVRRIREKLRRVFLGPDCYDPDDREAFSNLPETPPETPDSFFE